MMILFLLHPLPPMLGGRGKFAWFLVINLDAGRMVNSLDMAQVVVTKVVQLPEIDGVASYGRIKRGNREVIIEARTIFSKQIAPYKKGISRVSWELNTKLTTGPSSNFGRCTIIFSLSPWCLAIITNSQIIISRIA